MAQLVKHDPKHEDPRTEGSSWTQADTEKRRPGGPGELMSSSLGSWPPDMHTLNHRYPREGRVG